MDLLNWFTLLFYFVQVTIVVVTALVVLMENRQPVKTMAWLMVLGFLPFVGFIFYLFFGKNTRKEKYISKHSLDLLTRQSMSHFAEQSQLHIPEEHAELVRQFANQKVALPFNNNEVEVYVDGYEFFPALLRAIRYQEMPALRIQIYN